MNQKTYYLSSLDSIKFELTRTCTFEKKLHFDTGKECVLVTLDPPLIGQDYGVGEDLTRFVIANRCEGEALDPIETFPCFVFVTRPLIASIESRSEINKDEVQIVAWGELYRTKADADNHVFESRVSKPRA